MSEKAKTWRTLTFEPMATRRALEAAEDAALCGKIAVSQVRAFAQAYDQEPEKTADLIDGLPELYERACSNSWSGRERTVRRVVSDVPDAEEETLWKLWQASSLG